VALSEGISDKRLRRFGLSKLAARHMDWYCQKTDALLSPSGNLSRHTDWYCQKADALLSPSGILPRRKSKQS